MPEIRNTGILENCKQIKLNLVVIASLSVDRLLVDRVRHEESGLY